jgi:hypothetical protein
MIVAGARAGAGAGAKIFDKLEPELTKTRPASQHYRYLCTGQTVQMINVKHTVDTVEISYTVMVIYHNLSRG